jgi:hypothetical protein
MLDSVAFDDDPGFESIGTDSALWPVASHASGKESVGLEDPGVESSGLAGFVVVGSTYTNTVTGSLPLDMPRRFRFLFFVGDSLTGSLSAASAPLPFTSGTTVTFSAIRAICDSLGSVATKTVLVPPEQPFVVVVVSLPDDAESWKTWIVTSAAADMPRLRLFLLREF